MIIVRGVDGAPWGGLEKGDQDWKPGMQRSVRGTLIGGFRKERRRGNGGRLVKRKEQVVVNPGSDWKKLSGDGGQGTKQKDVVAKENIGTTTRGEKREGTFLGELRRKGNTSWTRMRSRDPCLRLEAQDPGIRA